MIECDSRWPNATHNYTRSMAFVHRGLVSIQQCCTNPRNGLLAPHCTTHLFNVDGGQMLGEVAELGEHVLERAVLDELEDDVQALLSLVVVDVLHDVLVP